MTLSGCSASRNGISPSRVVGGQILPPNPTVGEGVLSPNEPPAPEPDVFTDTLAEIIARAQKRLAEKDASNSGPEIVTLSRCVRYIDPIPFGGDWYYLLAQGDPE